MIESRRSWGQDLVTHLKFLISPVPKIIFLVQIHNLKAYIVITIFWALLNY